MKVLHSLSELPSRPHAFTIGTFDGVHRGHQFLLQRLQSYGAPTAVLTFLDHPLRTLNPARAPKLLTGPETKQLLLEEQGIDLALLLPFTPAFASLSFDALLEQLPLSHLLLGQGAAFGRARQGDEPRVRAWSVSKNIPVEYLDPTLIPVSSGRVRDALSAGRLAEAAHMLGRKHLLYATAQEMPAAHLCLPPDGLYPLAEGGTVSIDRAQLRFSHPVHTPTFFHLETPHA